RGAFAFTPLTCWASRSCSTCSRRKELEYGYKEAPRSPALTSARQKKCQEKPRKSVQPLAVQAARARENAAAPQGSAALAHSPESATRSARRSRGAPARARRVNRRDTGH